MKRRYSVDHALSADKMAAFVTNDAFEMDDCNLSWFNPRCTHCAAEWLGR